jgi:hypothetical protein
VTFASPIYSTTSPYHKAFRFAYFVFCVLVIGFVGKQRYVTRFFIFFVVRCALFVPSAGRASYCARPSPAKTDRHARARAHVFHTQIQYNNIILIIIIMLLSSSSSPQSNVQILTFPVTLFFILSLCLTNDTLVHA